MAMIDLLEECQNNNIGNNNEDSSSDSVKKVIDFDNGNYGKPVSLISISKRQNISLSYLEQIFANLRKASIVKALKGPRGGYILTKNPSQISVSDIVKATGETIKMTNCGDSAKGCGAIKQNETRCKTHNLWKGLENNIHSYLDSIKLQDFCKK